MKIDKRHNETKVLLNISNNPEYYKLGRELVVIIYNAETKFMKMYLFDKLSVDFLSFLPQRFEDKSIPNSAITRKWLKKEYENLLTEGSEVH